MQFQTYVGSCCFLLWLRMDMQSLQSMLLQARLCRDLLSCWMCWISGSSRAGWSFAGCLWSSPSCAGCGGSRAGRLWSRSLSSLMLCNMTSFAAGAVICQWCRSAGSLLDGRSSALYKPWDLAATDWSFVWISNFISMYCSCTWKSPCSLQKAVYFHVTSRRVFPCSLPKGVFLGK